MGHLVTSSVAYVNSEIRCESDVDITGSYFSSSSPPPPPSDTTVAGEP